MRAEACDGFVWRLVDEDGADATGLRPFDEDVIVKLSVWKDVESLQAFVYNSRHRGFVRRRRQWFSAWQGPSYVLWWGVPGDRPTPHDGKQRLDLLAASAPAFRRRWPSPPPCDEPDVNC